MPLNFPSNPTTNDTYTYQGAVYIYDGTRWKLLSVEYNNSGSSLESIDNTTILDLSKGNMFNIDDVTNIVTVIFTNPSTDVHSFKVKVSVDPFYSSTWDIAGASYDNVSLLISSQETSPYSIAFKPDGTKMYMVGNWNDTVFQYTLATPWNMASATYDSVSFSVATQETNPLAIAFKPDGTKMYMVGNTNDRVYQYTLATPWNIASATYDSVSFSVATQETSPYGIAFKSDGTKMYMVGNTNRTVYQYTLATPWNIASATYDSVSFSVTTQDITPFDIAFKPDGTKMYMVGTGNGRVYQYTLATPWNIASATYDSVSFSVATQVGASTAIAFKPDGTKMYMLGFTNRTVYQYSTTSVTPSIVWPSSVMWESDVAPAISGIGKTSIFEFITSNGGTTYFGRRSEENVY